MSKPTALLTQGRHAFAECNPQGQALFVVAEGVPVADALQHASNLLACINNLTRSAAVERIDDEAIWAAHYLGEMAKAVIEAALPDLSDSGGSQ
ncbi:hypothetical protein D9M68_619470 [compost metagenome]